MKKMIGLLMFVSMSTFASTVTIQPGSSITLSADTTTTVTCQGSGNQGGGQSGAACYCLFTQNYVHEAILNLSGKSISLGMYMNRTECLKILAETPACK